MMTTPEPEIKALSTIQADLPVSWSSGIPPAYWYRVESECTSLDCENMGVDRDGCPSMTLITTVSARSLAELCDTLSNPRTNAPLTARISSISRYSRPVLRSDAQNDQCNVLQELEFCYIPECANFCAEPPVPLVFHSEPAPRLLRLPFDLDSVVAMADFEFGVEPDEFSLFAESGEEILAESGDPILGSYLVPSPPSPGLVISGSAAVSCTFFAHDSFGSLVVGGGSYFISPTATFQGSGLIEFGGSSPIVVDFDSYGGVALYGSASSLMSIHHQSEGSVFLTGSSINESPFHSYDSSGVVHVGGSSIVFFSNFGIREALADSYARAFGFGFEQTEDLSSSALTISDFSVAACGCPALGPTIILRHNLLESESFSRFLSSGGASLPESITLRHSANDLSWRDSHHLVGRNSSWDVFCSLSCQENQWRIDFSVVGEGKRTRLLVDVPSDLICSDSNITTSLVAYFNPLPIGVVGVGLEVVSPPKPLPLPVSPPVEVFVDGVFVPYTVYYDELNLFKGDRWLGIPFELGINPVARNKSSAMDISWVT